MTAIRKAYLIAIEDGFGTGTPLNDEWHYLPQGAYFSHSDSTQATSLYGTGAKIRQNSIYGAFQGSWNTSFVMDFNHLEMLSMIFDSEDKVYSDNPSDDSQSKYGANTALGNGVYEHRLRKYNGKRQRSYVIKEYILNTIAGGTYNELTTIKGVLARNLQIARSTSGSQMAVEMSGVFADKYTELLTEMTLPYTAYSDSPLTQYSCMYLSDDGNITDMDIVEQVDSHSINIETGVSLVYSTCSPIASDFFEDRSTFSWNATAYLNNPTKKFHLLANSGGTLDPNVGGVYEFTDQSNGRRYSKQPMGKNLAPLEYVDFITYNESVRDQWHGNYHESIVTAYEASDNLVGIQAVNSTVRVSSTPKGDGSKLQDSLSSVECDEIVITVRNRKEKIWNYGDRWIEGGTSPDVQTVNFTRAAVTGPPAISEMVFPMPVIGYVGQVLGYAFIPCSENAITQITFDGQDSAYANLTGFAVMNNPAQQSAAVSATDPTTYRLDNLVPKQLTIGGAAGPSGLTVGTGAVTTADDPNTDADESAGFCPVITGTPSIARTDYYFIVKDNGQAAVPRYTTGYIRVTVR